MIFLRPWFLLALLIPFFIKGVRHFKKEETPWAKFVDKKLLNALLIKGKEKKQAGGLSWKAWTLWGVWCVALAGPAFYKLPTPAVESAPNSIIVFDLSMQGKDLLQGQAKLYDLLTALKGERVGLVVFGNKQGYTAMPLTPDIGLVKEVVPSLSPMVLPENATNPQAGFQYAAELLNQAGTKGRILYVSNKPQNWKGNYPFGVLDLTKRTADTSDIQNLLKKTKTEATVSDNTFLRNADVWADLGGWIILLTLPFFAWMFRKGGLFLALFLLATNVQAGFLWRPDQEIYKADKKGIEAYQKKEYQSAVNLFQQSGNLYNLGNALAFAGDIQRAIDAYTKELEKNPANKDAKFNKEYLEKQLPPPEDQAQQNEDGESEENKNNSDEQSDQDQSGKNQEKEQENESQNNNSNGQTENQESESQKDQSQHQPTQEETQAELEQALAEYEQESPYNQEEQQIINRLNHDPSRVLRYRLMLQHEKGKAR